MTAQIRLSVAALVRDGLVLLVHRHPTRQQYPDCWDLVGGHVEPGELPQQAVSRECLEEVGVHVHDPRPIPKTISDPTLDIRWFRPRDLAHMKMAHPASLPSILSAVQIGG